MMDAGTLELVELEDMLSHTLACAASVSHPQGAWGHVVGQDASWLLEAPCGTSRYFCDGGYRAILSHGSVRCVGPEPCRAIHRLEDISVRPV